MVDFSIYDLFAHGSEYEGEDTPVEVPRSKSCNSCAFTNCKASVRPSVISLTQLLEQGDTFDVFYCHEKDHDGKLKICASWYKHFGELCLPRNVEAEAQIDALLNRDEPCPY